MVNNLSDFEIHVSAHIQRVRVLGQFIAQHYFPMVDLKLLGEFLKIHDAEKLLDSPDFRKVMDIAPNEPSMLEKLFRHFGRHRELRTADEIRDFEATRSQLNHLGRRISQQWLRAHGLWNVGLGQAEGQGREFCIIEHLADILDRELDPIASHELGKSFAEMPNSANSYVDTNLEREILKGVRPHYARLAEDYTYLNWSQNSKKATVPSAAFWDLFSNVLTTR